MEKALPVPFRYEGNERVKKLLEGFKDMVNWSVERALENNVTSYPMLRELVYDEYMSRSGFRKLQATIEYKAKLAGLSIKPVKAKEKSIPCPICRVKLIPSGYGLMKRPKCGLEEDRDIIAILNLL